MLQEYAVEPQAIAANWDTFRYLIEKFGVDQGRLISRFPRKWERWVIEAASELPDVEKHTLIEKLNCTKKNRVASGRPYDEQITWPENAVSQQDEAPFHAIIAHENPENRDYILTPAEVDDAHPLINVPPEIAVPRTAEALAAVAAPLLQNSREILFLDPHFKPRRPKWTHVLEAFLKASIPGKHHISRCEYHFDWTNEELSREELNRCCTNLADLITNRLNVTFMAWKPRENGEKFHARYILTDIGGIRFDVGLDYEIGDEGQTTDMGLLGNDLYLRRWKELQLETAAFDLVHQTTVTGCAGSD